MHTLHPANLNTNLKQTVLLAVAGSAIFVMVLWGLAEMAIPVQ